MSDVHQYVGTELDLFADAVRWKSYLKKELRPFISGSVLEVGAGIGGTTRFLKSDAVSHWTCLEPDPALAERIRLWKVSQPDSESLSVAIGTTSELPVIPEYDTILYVDVLEHIEQDGDELQRASLLLRPGGRLIVLSPAHQWLFSPFDKAIGHFRRYNRTEISRLTPPGMVLHRFRYLDSVGLLASSANRFLLRSGMPSSGQIRVWDRMMVPLSRCLDRVLGYHVGKSLYAVWRRQ